MSVASCLAAISATDGEGARTFTQVYADSALAAAAASEKRRREGTLLSSLDGSAVAVKDLFDVQGQTTWAASRVLRDAPAASTDAPAVARLRRAGAVIIGKTNMTEFAYSGLGLNPHFGTPANPYRRNELRRIPGGSSSGAAIAITDGMADLSLGTDTGGSVRIPAALCGLVGWKPTARRISLEGVWPLAPSLDSVGVIARTVEACAEADAVIATEAVQPGAGKPVRELRLARLRGYVENELEPPVAAAYERALARLSAAGIKVLDLSIPDLERIPRELPGVTIITYEAFRTHASLLERSAALYDPRVRMRLELGRSITGAQYAAAQAIRAELRRIAEKTMQRFDACLLPTVSRVAPPLSAFESDEAYIAINRAMLRNTSLINFLDGCAVSLPCQGRDEPPVGLSLAGPAMHDAQLLTAARVLAPLVAGNV